MSDVNYAEFRKMQGEKRKRLQAKTKKPGHSGNGTVGGGASFEIPAWKLRQEYFKPGPQPTKIRIVPNDNGDLWYRYMSKWVSTSKGKRKIISNSHNGERDMPCVLDFYALEQGNDDYVASDELVSSVVVMEHHFKIPKVSGRGNEYFVYERSLGTDRHGRSLDPVEYKDHETVFGRKLHWSMWPSQQRNFMDSIVGLTDKCSNCKAGEISIYAYSCPLCEGVIADHRDDESSLDRDREDSLRVQNTQCPHCNRSVKAVQQFECVKQEGYGGRWVKGCDNPQRISLDKPIDLVIRAVPAGKSQAIEIIEFGPANEDADIAPWMHKPFEFDKFFGKMDLQDQADAMGVVMPFNDSAQVLVDNFFNALPDMDDEDSIPF